MSQQLEVHQVKVRYLFGTQHHKKSAVPISNEPNPAAITVLLVFVLPNNLYTYEC